MSIRALHHSRRINREMGKMFTITGNRPNYAKVDAGGFRDEINCQEDSRLHLPYPDNLASAGLMPAGD